MKILKYVDKIFNFTEVINLHLMRILKYLFLLLLLFLFGTSVYIATQKGDFYVERSQVIKSPKTTLFNYVNDYRNWETFGSWKKEDPKMTFSYPKNTVGNGGSYSWKGSDGEGSMKTIAVYKTDSIHQKMNFNGSLSDVKWVFKDTLGGTKVTWSSKGTMNFGFKIYAVFNGGVERVIGSMYEKSLANLDKTLDYEIHTYKVKVIGLVRKLGTFYLKQTIISKISNVPLNLRIMIPNMIHFFQKNNLAMTGQPFVIYHTYDLAAGITKFSVCIPIKEEVFISEGSDVSSGLLYPFQAVKTTLTGDYSHSKEAWDKTTDYIKANHLTENKESTHIEVYTKNMVQVANPSQWVTDIYIPINTKATPVAKPTIAAQPIETPLEKPREPTEP